MPGDVKVEVHGVRELRAALRKAEGRTPKEIQVANRQAAEVVVRTAIIKAPKGPHEGGGNVQPIWSSIKARATSNRGLIVFGGTQSPHAPVYEFGGSIPRRGARKTHRGAIGEAQRRHRGFAELGISTTHIDKRAYVYPAIEATRPQVLERYEHALNRIARDL